MNINIIYNICEQYVNTDSIWVDYWYFLELLLNTNKNKLIEI